MSKSTLSAPRVSEVRCSHLSPARKRLARVLQNLQFGRIEDLQIAGGEPVFSPSPSIIRTVKFAGRPQGVSPIPANTDFALRREVVELLEHLARLGHGVIRRIEVAHGLPLFLEMHASSAA